MNGSLRLGPVSVAYSGGPETCVFLLLGHPVAHSRSPQMQTAALVAAGLDATYVACDVRPEELGDVVRALRERAVEGRIGGANVTVPHKRAIGAGLDAVDPQAAMAGAVNTIVVRRDAAGGVQLHGHDTDIAGLIAALAEAGGTLRGARVVVAGAGGMARAAVVAALQSGAAVIRVLARDPSRAQELLDDIAAAWRGRLPHLACAELGPDAAAQLADADVLVQATSLGMHADDPVPIALDAASAGLVVLDAVYARGDTPLVRAARARGLRACDGHGLLLHQGAAAFTLWTGRTPSLDAMRRALAS